ncbi:type II secretion system protein GspM [candidate division CSSED10-310 bacterium]|uniref:Type II secretion system protein GspM n=1 Tax=candidate division CSSED10-310 bacterium TaxID=2855610 RepID=A0ABV6Z6S9_UNCC1
MKLAQREKIFIISGSILLAVMLIYMGFVEPYMERLQKLQQLIPKKEAQIKECQAMVGEYSKLKQILDEHKKRISENDSASFMQSYLESEASALSLTIASMVPKSHDLNDIYREDQVEIKLERITLDALVSFLHRIENSKRFLSIHNLRIKRRYDDHTQSDVTVNISTLIKK